MDLIVIADSLFINKINIKYKNRMWPTHDFEIQKYIFYENDQCL